MQSGNEMLRDFKSTKTEVRTFNQQNFQVISWQNFEIINCRRQYRVISAFDQVFVFCIAEIFLGEF